MTAPFISESVHRSTEICKDYEENVIKHIQMAMDILKMNEEMLEWCAGLKSGTLGKWFKREKHIKLKPYLQVCSYLQVSPDYMYSDNFGSPFPELQTEGDWQYYWKFRLLPEESKELILKIAEEFLKQDEKEKE